MFAISASFATAQITWPRGDDNSPRSDASSRVRDFREQPLKTGCDARSPPLHASPKKLRRVQDFATLDGHRKRRQGAAGSAYRTSSLPMPKSPWFTKSSPYWSRTEARNSVEGCAPSNTGPTVAACNNFNRTE